MKFSSDGIARKNARFRALKTWVIVSIFTAFWITIVLYLGWDTMEKWTWVISIIIGLFITGLACWYLDDNYIPLSPSRIFNQEKTKMYEKFKVNLIEGEIISRELEKAKREIQSLTE